MTENLQELDALIDDSNDGEFNYVADSNDDALDSETNSSNRSLQLTCFSCNRLDYHYVALRRAWYYAYLTGLTFGFIKLLGPYRCKCCGHHRWLRYDWMHPKKWRMDSKRRTKSRR